MFFGMHVLPTVAGSSGTTFYPPDACISARRRRLPRLAEPHPERISALERPWWRYDVGVKYGLLSAQISLALSGADRDQVLAQLLELLAIRELQRTGSDNTEQRA
jgi:UTP--glucose-1-phosphate uridylyltransferase